jgi:hypothetical protein
VCSEAILAHLRGAPRGLRGGRQLLFLMLYYFLLISVIYQTALVFFEFFEVCLISRDVLYK